MSKIIAQTILFKNTKPETLYAIYMDSKKHGLAIGSVVSIKNKVGGKFTSWDGYITGINLHLVSGRMIVQTWRSTEFKKEETDSVLTLNFLKKGNDAVIEMVHANVPEHYKQVKEGWHQYYWKPWKAYLKKIKN